MAGDGGAAGRSARPAAKGPEAGEAASGARDGRSFLVRHRLPLVLAVVALCGYVGSIVYIIYVRGQIG